MYTKLKAKLLILPDWLDQAMQAHRLSEKDLITAEGLASILSPRDVSFYQEQVGALAASLEANESNPLSSLVASLSLLHRDSPTLVRAHTGASGLEKPVEKYTSYGDKTEKFNFFGGFDTRPLLPRAIGGRIAEGVLVTPLLSYVGKDTFVLRFALGGADATDIADQYVRTLVSVYGFDAVVPTELFDLKTQL